MITILGSPFSWKSVAGKSQQQSFITAEQAAGAVLSFDVFLRGRLYDPSPGLLAVGHRRQNWRRVVPVHVVHPVVGGPLSKASEKQTHANNYRTFSPSKTSQPPCQLISSRLPTTWSSWEGAQQGQIQV
jgi:hypothetical protein